MESELSWTEAMPSHPYTTGRGVSRAVDSLTLTSNPWSAPYRLIYSPPTAAAIKLPANSMSTSQSNGLPVGAPSPAFPTPPGAYYHADPRGPAMYHEDAARFMAPVQKAAAYPHHHPPINYRRVIDGPPEVSKEQNSSAFGVPPPDYARMGPIYPPASSCAAIVTSSGPQGGLSAAEAGLESGKLQRQHHQHPNSAFLRYPPIPPQRQTGGGGGGSFPGGPPLSAAAHPRPSPPILPNASGRAQVMPPMSVYQPFSSLPSKVRLQHVAEATSRQHSVYPSPSPFSVHHGLPPPPGALNPIVGPPSGPPPAYPPVSSTSGGGGGPPRSTAEDLSEGAQGATINTILAAEERDVEKEEVGGRSGEVPGPGDPVGTEAGTGTTTATATTEEEVQRLITLALSNNQARVEKSFVGGKEEEEMVQEGDLLAPLEIGGISKPPLSREEVEPEQLKEEEEVLALVKAEAEEVQHTAPTEIVFPPMHTSLSQSSSPRHYPPDLLNCGPTSDNQRPFVENGVFPPDDDVEEDEDDVDEMEALADDPRAAEEESNITSPPTTATSMMAGGGAAEFEKSLEISLETRNAMESSGSPGELERTEEHHEMMMIGGGEIASTPSDQQSHVEDSNHAPSNPTESERLSPESDDGMTLAKFELFASAIQPDKQGIFFCHLCEFTGKTRGEFHDHLRSHYDYKCPKCDYTSRTEGRLKRHLNDFHSKIPPQNFSGKITRVNKPKTLKCKQCDFLAQTKDEYWLHQRSHIKEEKRLECPRCPFVTEYKHHLEYHIRNHFGSKPYKCDKCNYMCVNKSMLNSHMKSHTNVYQYRCADCQYATKYCHSLKLHLAKNNHTPATVLNADGSLPEYDNSSEILNMKRGPPRGVRVSNNNNNNHTTNNQSRSGDMLDQGPRPPMLPMPNHNTARPPPGLVGDSMHVGMPPAPNSFFPSPHGPPPPPGLWSFLPQHVPGFPLLPPPFNLPHGISFPKMPPGFPGSGPNNAGLSLQLATSMADAPLPPVSLPCGPALSSVSKIGDSPVCAFCGVKCESQEDLAHHWMKQHGLETGLPFGPPPIEVKQPVHLSGQLQEDSGILDLSCAAGGKTPLPARRKAPVPPHTDLGLNDDRESLGGGDCSPYGDHQSMGEDQACGGGYGTLRKRPRKSKAFRLDKILSSRFQSSNKSGDTSVATDETTGGDGSYSSPAIIAASGELRSNDQSGAVASLAASASSNQQQQRKDVYDCQHCDITFKGRTLFDIHMGYHCHADPFLCNRCGRQSRDKVEFFTHLYEVPHA